jgi:RND superfamily putative drug exporter
VVIVLLLVTYRSPTLWVLPVISAGVALAGSQALIYLLAKHAGMTMNAQSAGILSVLVFGAGTDYALLLTARYREELRRHAGRHKAMAKALRRAGPAVIASAAMVILALLVLMVAELNSTSSLGPVLAIVSGWRCCRCSPCCRPAGDLRAVGVLARPRMKRAQCARLGRGVLRH